MEIYYDDYVEVNDWEDCKFNDLLLQHNQPVGQNSREISKSFGKLLHESMQIHIPQHVSDELDIETHDDDIREKIKLVPMDDDDNHKTFLLNIKHQFIKNMYIFINQELYDAINENSKYSSEIYFDFVCGRDTIITISWNMNEMMKKIMKKNNIYKNNMVGIPLFVLNMISNKNYGKKYYGLYLESFKYHMIQIRFSFRNHDQKYYKSSFVEYDSVPNLYCLDYKSREYNIMSNKIVEFDLNPYTNQYQFDVDHSGTMLSYVFLTFYNDVNVVDNFEEISIEKIQIKHGDNQREFTGSQLIKIKNTNTHLLSLCKKVNSYSNIEKILDIDHTNSGLIFRGHGAIFELHLNTTAKNKCVVELVYSNILRVFSGMGGKGYI